MSDFNKKVQDATERLEKESAEFIKYLNDEVVPAVRQHSTQALRVAAKKMTELADTMEKHTPARK
jgi:prophage antirepressor-like protein